MSIRKIFNIISNEKVASKTYKMHLDGDTSLFSAPGQFVNIAIEGKYLRRPISVCDYDSNSLTLLYDVVGSGTTIMSTWQSGKEVDMLVALGNGFDVNVECKYPILLGGGVGNAPLLGLAKALMMAGKHPKVVMGFNTCSDITLFRELSELGIETYVSTVDGSDGTKGFVTDAIMSHNLSFDYFYACGPTPMLKAVCTGIMLPGEVSLESRMGCGFGACVCCTVKTADGVKQICKDGPVFKKEELIWI